MKHSNLEDRLAIVAALIVLFGVTMAAEDALGDDAGITGAAETVTLDTGIGLDIQREDHTSELIAGRQ